MLLYDVQRECDAHVRSPEMRPLIREFIQKAIENICNANAPGQDWSFLRRTLGIDRSAESTDTCLVFDAPSNLRALIEVLSLGDVPFDTLIGEGYAYQIEWTGRTLTIKRSSSSVAFPSGQLNVSAYLAHPSVLVQDEGHANPTYDTPWTPTWPPASATWLPDEAFPLLVDESLLELRKHGDEIAFTIQELDQSIKEKLAELRANYALQVYPLNPPSTPTVKWLVAVGNSVVGSERYKMQMLTIINEIASDLADAVQLRLDQRPTAILAITETALPQIGSITVPPQFWYAGMELKASFLTGTANQQAAEKWERAKAEWQTSFYALNVQSAGFSVDTFGGLVDYIRREWKTCRNEMQAWDIVNEVVADIMERVNSESLMATSTINVAAGTKEYTLPTNFKAVVKVTLDGVEIPGRGFLERGPAVRNINEYTGLAPTRQAFRIAGGKLMLDLTPERDGSMVVYYFPYHTWTTTPSTTVPVKTTAVMRGVRAQIALAEKDTAGASYWSQKYEQAIQQYDANQTNNYPADNRMINATPQVNRHILRAFH